MRFVLFLVKNSFINHKIVTFVFPMVTGYALGRVQWASLTGFYLV